ncbi:MAG: hypothetical protein NWQ13_00300, partial [Glaciimonas sp.]|nr:hypothetical protein [Glaciimonas sp.]
IGAAPDTLNTLDKLANSLGDEPNFATAMWNALSFKASLASPALTGVPTSPTPTQFDSSKQLSTMEAVQRAIGNYRDSIGISTHAILGVQHIGMRIVVGANAAQLTFTMPQMSLLRKGATITFQNLSGKLLNLVQASASDKFMSFFDPSGTALSYLVPVGGEVTATVYGNGNTWLIGGTGDFSNAQFRSSLIENGWKRFADSSSPSGFMILQWGSATAQIAGAYIPFPIAFPHACLTVNLTTANGNSVGSVSTGIPTTTAFDAYSSTGAITARFLAIGY